MLSGVLIAIKLAGAAYLLYLAWLALYGEAISAKQRSGRYSVSSARRLYRPRASIMNISNPKRKVFSFWQFYRNLPQQGLWPDLRKDLFAEESSS